MQHQRVSEKIMNLESLSGKRKDFGNCLWLIDGDYLLGRACHAGEGRRLDYLRLRNHLDDHFNIQRVVFYTSIAHYMDDHRSHNYAADRFHDWLELLPPKGPGFVVHKCEYDHEPAGSKTVWVALQIHIKMALELLDCINLYDTFIFSSQELPYQGALKILQTRHKKNAFQIDFAEWNYAEKGNERAADRTMDRPGTIYIDDFIANVRRESNSDRPESETSHDELD